jgi:hypothetical protein
MNESVKEYLFLRRNQALATKSNSNNPEQKTQNAKITEFSSELSPVGAVKQKNAKKGQPQRSKQG